MNPPQIGPTPKLDGINAVFEERAAYFLRNHQSAMEFVRAVFNVFHVWDDLIDRDREVTDEEVMTAFWMALVALPTNAFYMKHFSVLHPILVNAIVNWRAATAMEREGDDHDRTIAFILRGTYGDVLSVSALLIGGLEWSVQVTPDIRRWMHPERYQEYLDNLRAEREARNVVQ